MDKLETATLHIEVDIKASDFLHANLWRYYFNWPMAIFMWILATCATFLLASGIYWWWHSGLELSSPFPMFSILVPFFVVFGIPASSFIDAKVKISKLKEFQKTVIFEFSHNKDGYSVGDEKTHSQISWESVTKVVEAKHAFHFFHGDSPFVVLPKRCIKPESYIDELRRILIKQLHGRAKLRVQ